MEEARAVDGAADKGAAAGMAGLLNSAMFLESELGIDEDTAEDSSPLREKNARIALALKNGKAKSGSKTVSSKERTKTKGKKSGKSEKENANANTIPGDAYRITSTDAGALTKKGRVSPVFGGVGTTAAVTTAVKKLSANGKGGARRVPIGSADAAPLGPGWK